MATEIDDGLTDAERAAIASDDDIIETDGETETHEYADAQDDGEEAPGADGDDDGATGSDDAADTASQPAEAAYDAATEQPAEPAPESAPLLVAQAPEDAEAKLADIASQKEALLTEFDDGEITAREYQQKLEKLNKDERQIELAIHEAQLASKMEQQRQVNEWNATVNGFITENPRYNPKTSPRMYQMLDMEVRAVATSDEFKGRTDTAAGRLILQRAHENLAKELGFEAKPSGKQQKVPKPALPPSLHTAPAAEVSETSNGKWAVLDRMQATDPIGYEEALMKLSDRDREAYLSA